MADRFCGPLFVAAAGHPKGSARFPQGSRKLPARFRKVSAKFLFWRCFLEIIRKNRKKEGWGADFHNFSRFGADFGNIREKSRRQMFMRRDFHNFSRFGTDFGNIREIPSFFSKITRSESKSTCLETLRASAFRVF